MATQEEFGLLGSALLNQPILSGCRYRILIGIAPRMQPFDESMESLAVCVAHAAKMGIESVVQKVRRGVPGFQNWGPSLWHLLSDKTISHIFAAADDMIYPLNIFDRLISADKDIVSAIYRKAEIEGIWPANWVEDANSFVEKYKVGGLHESKFASGHTMLIKRHVIEKMVEDYPELAYTNTHDGSTHYALHLPMIKDGFCYQDDWAFSMRARQSGFTIWDDYGCRCGHWGGAFLTFPEIREEVHAGS